jgi:preprotein translocase subunit SecE
MRKVTWPTRSELVSSTIIVIVISVFVAVVIFILDRIFSIGLGFILR